MRLIRVRCRSFFREESAAEVMCDWVGYRVYGSIKPCPRCGGVMPAAGVWI